MKVIPYVIVIVDVTDVIVIVGVTEYPVSALVTVKDVITPEPVIRVIVVPILLPDTVICVFAATCLQVPPAA